MRFLAGLMVVYAAIAISIAEPARQPWLIWNASGSVPIGLYRVEQRIPGTGDLAVVRLDPDVAHLANASGYLRGTDYVLKPVAAVGPGTVCRFGSRILIDGRIVAEAHATDADQRPMPEWSGCRRLRASELFLLSPVAGSFDSRYFGPVRGDMIVGKAVPLWLRSRNFSASAAG